MTEQQDLTMMDNNVEALAGSSDHASEEDVFFISMYYRGQSYEVPVQAGEAVSSIFDFVQEVLDFPRENCKLICRGKVLRPDDGVKETGGSAVSLRPGSKVMLMATSAHDKSFVQSSRPDPLVKGFVEEERDERSRQKKARAAARGAWGTKQDSEFCFASIKAEFKFSTPPPFEAEALLKRLATDPGIIEIMTTRKFRVGIPTEMSPVEAQERMAKRGTPNMDLLGYNQNAGEMIVLRLRTDSLKGFRPYHDLINTLLHELTHNVWGPHDHNFWKLYGELKAQYMKFHRFWSHGGRAVDSNAGGQFNGFVGDEDEDGQGEGSSRGGGFGHVLGSAADPSTEQALPAAAVLTAEERRKRAAAAAADRAAKTSQTSSRRTGKQSASLDEGRDSSGPSDTSRKELQQVAVAEDGGQSMGSDIGGKVSVSLGGFDFLKSGAGWVIACPCGLQHPIDQCPQGFVASLQGEEGLQGSEQQPQEGPAVARPSSEDAMDVELSEAQADVTAMEVDVDVPATAGSLSMIGSVQKPAPETPELQTSGPGVTQANLSGDGLTAAELASMGLDGAAVWLQRFSEKLTMLHVSGQPASVSAAVETLLRLVQNIVDNPEESKFRRVRASNPRIQAKLLQVGAEVEGLLAMLGFEAAFEDGERVFAIRDKAFDVARLRLGQEALEQQLRRVAVPAH